MYFKGGINQGLSMKYEKLKYHFTRWNKWRRLNNGGLIYKLSVLLFLEHSPSFEAEKIYNKR